MQEQQQSDGSARFARATQYLAALSPGQKLIAGTLVVVMIVTGIYLTNSGAAGSHISGKSAAGGWEPVLDQSFSEANISSIVEHLREKSIPCELRNGKVYVPAEKKLDALSSLYYSAVLTGPAEGGFDTLVKEMSAWDAPSKTDKLFNRARETMVEQVISRFHGVRKATVLIDPTNERHISGSIQPTAMVDIQTEGGGSDVGERQLASAATNVLTGAVANLIADHVKITIDGASYNTPAGGGPTELVADGVLAHKQQCEQIYVAKVRQLLGYIPNVLVSVSVDLDLQSVEVEKHIVDPEKKDLASAAAVAATAAAAATATTGPSSVMANAVPSATAPRIEAAAVAPAASETVQKSHTPAGKETVRSASVVIPRSYFVGLYKRSTRKEIEPDDALLAPLIAANLSKIRGLVRNSLGVENDEEVSVEVYEDGAPVASAPEPTAASVLPAASAVTPAAWSWGPKIDRQIEYGLLGITIVLTLLLLFRRPGQVALAASTSAAVTPVMRVGRPPRHEQVLGGTLVGERDALLNDDGDVDGESGELEDPDGGVAGDEVEAHDMFRRVRDVVEENPEEAARVLREWIYQGQSGGGGGGNGGNGGGNRGGHAR